MRRIKTFLIMFLSFLALSLFALLPHFISAAVDAVESKTVNTAPIPPVDIALANDETAKPGYMLRKLALESTMTTIPISPEKAKLSLDEVLTAARDGMAYYAEANMFDWFEYTFFSAQPYLGIDPKSPNNTMIFWGVTICTESEPYHGLFLHIDDETGSILYLDYETHGPDQSRYVEQEDQHLMMEGFVDSFLRPLNLTAGQLTDNPVFPVDVNAYAQDLSGNVTYAAYTFESAEYKPIHVVFKISPTGFCVNCPTD